MVQPIPGINANDPIDTLSMHLRTLAASPRNLFALLGAGQAAIDVGDPNAALGFFARAEEIDPRSSKAKAGLASALVMLEKPDDALRVFGEAVSLGMPENEIARDRGLAYDLRGDNRRAQRDYIAALRRGPDDEVIRRYALSLGISGDRSQALTVLDPLLRKQDQGAWRARAFIMAMNNDVPGANAIARQVMPASLAGTMSPFLSRLAKLNPAERAHAVNFGTIPMDGQSFAAVSLGDPFRAVGDAGAATGRSDGLIPAGAPLGRQTVAAAQPVPRDDGRRSKRPTVTFAAASPVVTAVVKSSSLPTPAPTPGFSVAARPSTRVGVRIADVDPAKLPPELRGEAPRTVTMLPIGTSLPPPDNVRIAAVATPPVAVAPTPVAAPTVVAASATTTNLPLPPAPIVEADPGLTTPPAGPIGPPREPAAGTAPVFEVAAAPVARAVPPPSGAVAPVPQSRLAAILAGIETESESAPVVLPTLAELRVTQRAAAKKSAAAAEAAAAAQIAKDEKAKVAAAAKANPARLWVQVATGSNARGLGTTWRKIREANAALLKPYGGYSAPFKATNRVLAGPVKSSADARALINALGKAGVSATTYSSEAGQEVLKLAAK